MKNREKRWSEIKKGEMERDRGKVKINKYNFISGMGCILKLKIKQQKGKETRERNKGTKGKRLKYRKEIETKNGR